MAALLAFLLVSALIADSLQEIVYIDEGSLTSIPEGLVSPTVTHLHAENNAITDLDTIPKLLSLTKLYLNRNKLYSFPNLENVADTLVFLNLEYNNISYIDGQRLDVLTHLSALYLTDNTLSSIPDVSGPSQTLTTLKLEYNHFTTFPEWEFLGKSLQSLNFNNNYLSEITEDMFRNITQLKYLFMDGNSLTKFSLPGSLKLVTLLLVGNALTEFPNVGNGAKLVTLEVSRNQLTNIPAEILSRLTSLEKIDLEDNHITNDGIPDVAGPNGRLETLILSYNLISEMPKLENLGKALKTLYIKGTILEVTDEDLDYYPVLKDLDLSRSTISEFPYLPRNGPKLDTLNLYSNQIERITVAQLQPLQNLSLITCSRNRLTSVPNFCFAKYRPNLRLDLKYNPFLCDARMVLALETSANFPSYTLDVANTDCSQPLHLQDQDVETVSMEQIETQIEADDKFIDGEFHEIEPPFNCYPPIISMEASLSSFTCAITCSQSTSCLIFGYLSDVGDDLEAPGICAITSMSGTALAININNFKWFARM